MTELHGHGDPLLAAVMKDTALVQMTDDATKAQVVSQSHSIAGHGDPLFQEAQDDHSSPKPALHSEFEGHGDPLLEAVAKNWVETPFGRKISHDVVHTEFQSHGDPLLKEYGTPVKNRRKGQTSETPHVLRKVFGW